VVPVVVYSPVVPVIPVVPAANDSVSSSFSFQLELQL
jgi:hypothetical protein